MKENYFRDMGKYLQELQSVNQLFQSWDYKPTLVPLVDSYEPYKAVTDSHVSHSYRFLDTNSTLLLLRSDSTLFLARMISKHLDHNTLPVRLCYANSVVRPVKTLNDNEIQQNGIELIGIPNIAGDFEIILLIYLALKTIAPQSYRIHIGSYAILNDALTHINPHFTVEQRKTIIQYCRERNFSKIAEYTHSAFAEIIISIMNINEFRDKAQDIARLLGNDTRSLFQYHTLIEALAHTVDTDCIRCDFTEVGAHDYYNNIVFSAYAKNQGAAVAQGGRYDGLMEHFGSKISAVGATLFPHNLIPYLLSKEQPEQQIINAEGRNAFNALSDIPSPSIKELVTCAKSQLGDML